MCVFIKFEVSSVINYFEVTPKILLPPLSAVTARPEPFLLHDLAGLCSACSTSAQ